MINVFSVKNNEILIVAPGKANENRIKNDLVWDINGVLTERFSLYKLLITKHPYHYNSIFCTPTTRFSKKYIIFQELDEDFVKRKKINPSEIDQYRRIMDPQKRMNDDVFIEACCLENVDIEYVAIDNINGCLNADVRCRSMAARKKWIVSFSPVYISLFGAKEMRIIINDSDLFERIMCVVMRHCVAQAYNRR